MIGSKHRSEPQRFPVACSNIHTSVSVQVLSFSIDLKLASYMGFVIPSVEYA